MYFRYVNFHKRLVMSKNDISPKNQEIRVDIPSLGICTLLPINTLPPSLRSYDRLRTTATELGLFEFSELTHPQKQIIFKSVATAISNKKKDLGAETGVDIIFSGAHPSYAILDLFEPDLPMVQCVTVLQLYYEPSESYFLEPRHRGVVECMFEELSVSAVLTVENEDLVYGLFLGEL